MTRLVIILFTATLLVMPAMASDTPAAPEPIGVAVAPPDGGLPKAATAGQIPTAESKAAPSSDALEPDHTSAGKLDNGGPGLALKIKPFGWVIRLFGR